jgi:DNA-binding GntR family transcriptional regulator
MPPIAQHSLHGELLGRLREMIADGELPIGEKIPERNLCEQFGVSRTPLREAIKVLAAEGLVRLEPHRGAIVNELTPEELDEYLPIFSALEELSAEQACEHITDEEIETIRGYHEQLGIAYAAGRSEDFITWNHKIHHSIFAAARNPLLTSLYEATSLRVGRRRVCTRLPRETVEQAMEEHAEILAALEARQGARLAALLRAHIERVLGVYSRTLKAARNKDIEKA